MKTEIFDITPGTNLIDVFSSSGYTMESAIADIIDNSISAYAKNILIIWNPKQKDILRIIDDGIGMNKNELRDSIILAKKSVKDRNNLNDLGKFSVGLKTASMSYANKLKIVTKQKLKTYIAVEIDFLRIKENEKWLATTIEPLVEDKFDYFESGTCITWNDIKVEDDIYKDDRSILNKLSRLEQHVSHVFGFIMLNKKVKIYLNSFDYLIKPYDPFFIQENSKIIQETEITYKNEKIHITSYILPTTTNFKKNDKDRLIGRGLAEQQGFYVYRNDRLIYEGGWLNIDGLKIDNKSNYARIKVNINNRLDSEFKLNYEKSKVQLPESLILEFKRIALKARKESRYNYEYKTSGIKIKAGRNPINYSKVWIHKKNSKEDRLFINRNHQIIKNLLIEDPKIEGMLRLIENAIPVNIIQNSNIRNDKLHYNDLMVLLEQTYQKLRIDGFNFEDINKKIFNLEPFDIDEYQMIILKYLKEKKEVDF